MKPTHALLPLGLGASAGAAASLVPPWMVEGTLAWAVALALLAGMSLSGGRTLQSLSPMTVMVGAVLLYGLVQPLVLLRSGGTWIGQTDLGPWYGHVLTMSAFALIGLAVGAVAADQHVDRNEQSSIVDERADEQSAMRIDVRLRILIRVALLIAIAWFSALLFYQGVGGRVVQLSEQLSQNTPGYLTLAPAVLGSVALMAVLTLRGSPVFRALAALSFSAAVAYFVSVGVRYSLFTLVIAGVLLAAQRRRKKPVRAIRFAVLAVGPVWLLTGLMGQLRGGGSTELAAIAQRSESAIEIVNPLAGVASYVDASGHALGRTYLDVPATLVPSDIWQEKPEPHLFQVLETFSRRGEGRAYPYWGELYLNFGLAGVVIGMAATGYLFQRGWIHLWRQARGGDAASQVAQTLAAILIPLSFHWMSRGHLAGLVHNSLALTGVPLLMIALSRQGRPIRDEMH